jgi:hypothetical protein
VSEREREREGGGEVVELLSPNKRKNERKKEKMREREVERESQHCNIGFTVSPQTSNRKYIYVEVALLAHTVKPKNA